MSRTDKVIKGIAIGITVLMAIGILAIFYEVVRVIIALAEKVR